MTEMRDVDHTHPHTGEPFGSPHASHGPATATGTATAAPAVAADGGRPESERPGDEMRDVDHESPGEVGETGADRAFERGTEGRTDTV